jgi:hypothetical protein
MTKAMNGCDMKKLCQSVPVSPRKTDNDYLELYSFRAWVTILRVKSQWLTRSPGVSNSNHILAPFLIIVVAGVLDNFKQQTAVGTARGII